MQGLATRTRNRDLSLERLLLHQHANEPGREVDLVRSQIAQVVFSKPGLNGDNKELANLVESLERHTCRFAVTARPPAKPARSSEGITLFYWPELALAV